MLVARRIAVAQRSRLVSSKGRSLSSAGSEPQNFDNAEKARVFAGFFDAGLPMWSRMQELAHKQLPNGPSKILDLGCGPGEPACHFAAKYKVPTIASDLAPAMVELAKKRVATKGLGDFVECMVLDMADLSPIPTASVDLVIGQMSYMFVPDKAKALDETMRVLQPGGILVANVWQDFDLIRLAGGLMRAVTGPPKEPPPPNPNSPLSLAEPPVFDKLLCDAGFALTEDHNHIETLSFELGNVRDEQAFKMAALPVWDALAGFEDSGKYPTAWEQAQKAFPNVAEPFTDKDGNITIKGTFRIAVVKKG